MKRNALIVFEGIDGAGKATQVALLAKYFKKSGKRVTVFTSPRYDLPTGKVVLGALRGQYGDFLGLDPHLSSLPFLLDFSSWRSEILAALEKGVVICDRYIYSTVAFHAAKLAGKKRDAFIREIESLAFKSLGLPKPGRIVYLDVPVATAAVLMRGKKLDQFEKDRSYQARVAETYAKLRARSEWRTVSCVGREGILSPTAIHEKVLEAVQ